ncbi:hypothetical protein N2152v2_007320 [Parachlorella kessleri]
MEMAPGNAMAGNNTADLSSSNTVSDRSSDDFTALKNAALAQLKHKQRSRVMVLPSEEGGGAVKVLVPKKLSRAESRAVLKSMWREEDDTDVQHMLERIKARMERVGLPQPTVEVRYHNVSVETSAVVGDRRIPTLVRTVTSKVENVVGSRNRLRYAIIDNVSGILRPGRLTLLLGPPGSGKSVLLRTLAGRMRKLNNVQVSGEITYNGKTFDQFIPERSAAYISQVDNHFGELTVRETLEFSARCQTAGFQKAMLSAIEEREQELGIDPEPEVAAFMRATAFGQKNNVQVELVLRLLGLDICADTIVGNHMLRGISGGQKKRVTTGEMVVGPIKALFADEISTGLDSNTTFNIVKSLRAFCHVQQATFLIGLLQPAPETYDLFDDVMLISSGRICYHGPLDQVLPLFESLGFACPMRKGVADFLQEVTTSTDQKKYWSSSAVPYSFVTVKTIEATYQATPMYLDMQAELSRDSKAGAAPKAAPAATNGHVGSRPTGTVTAQKISRVAGSAGGDALQHSKYGATYWQLCKLLFWRAHALAWRNKLFIYVRTFQICLMSFVVATLFIQTPKESVEDGNLFLGVMFFGSIYMLIGGMSEMHLLTERLSVFYRQREMNFYPGWAFALPTFVFRLPYAVLDAALWCLISYWAVGFDNSVRFLMYFFLMFLIEIWAVSLFQALAAIAKDDTIASAAGSTLLLILMNTGGFIISKPAIPPWYIGAFWSNPWSYFTIGMAVNEMTGESWQHSNPATGAPNLGVEVLESRGFGTQYWWVWLSVGVAFASTFINLAAFVAACTFLSGPSRSALLTEEDLGEVELNRGVDTARSALAKKTITGESLKISRSTTDLELGKFSVVTNGDKPAHSASNGSLAAASGKEVAAYAGTGIRGYTTALPFEPLVFTFKDVSYSVPMPEGVEAKVIVTEGPHAGQLRLLDRISGAFKPGVLCSLMGASGAGKTTLMDVLAGRKTGGTISGEMYIKGFPKEQRTFARVTGYVEQEDSHLPQTTVREALMFSANLRLPTTVDAATRAKFVDEMMELVELDRLRDAYVGVLGANGLSLEQRKRLTIAVELVANPSIVFMDEPTTGLDARAASIVMQAVRNTVNTGRTVVCTVHQPSIDIFESFDELLLLKPGGQCIYFGPLGRESCRLINFFSSVPGVEKIRPRYNPANWLLEVTATHREEVLGLDFTQVYKDSQLAREMAGQIEKLHQPSAADHPLTYGELNVTTPFYQFQINLQRNFAMYWRNPAYNLSRLIVTLAVAFLFGSLFWDQGMDRSTAAGVVNVCGVLYAATLFVGATNAMTVQHVASMQRSVSYRERAAGMYGALPFSLAQLLVEVPYLLIQGAFFCCIAYFMIHFEYTAAKFFLFYLFFVLTLGYFTLMGIMNAMLTPNVALSNLLTSFLFGFWNLMSGFLIPQSRIRGWWIWMYWINPVTWTLYGLVDSQLGDVDNEYLTDYAGNSVPISLYVEDTFGYKYSMLGVCVAVLAGFCLVFAASAAIAFKRLSFLHR